MRFRHKFFGGAKNMAKKNGTEPQGETLPQFYFREWREHAGLSQSQLGKLLNMSKGAISRIELNQRAFTSDFLIDFQKAVGCSSIADPLLRAPFDHGGHALDNKPRPGRRHKGADTGPQEPVFELARDLRKRLRGNADNGAH